MMLEKVTSWPGLSSSQANVILLLAFLSMILVMMRIIFKHRIHLRDADNRDYESETYRMLALREEDRLDRYLDQSTLPFEEVLKASARRGKPRILEARAQPGTLRDDDEGQDPRP